MTYDANNAYGAGSDNTPTSGGGAGYGPGAAYGPGLGFGTDLDGAQSPDDLSRPLYGATFGQAVRRFFKKYFVFSGRASRSEFWWAMLFQGVIVIIGWALAVTGAVMSSAAAESSPGLTYGAQAAEPSGPGVAIMIIGLVLLGLTILALIVPTLAINWRRLHDANLAGPFYFLRFIPGIGDLIVLVMTILPSKPEGRRFDV